MKHPLISVGSLFDAGWQAVREDWRTTLNLTAGLISYVIVLAIIASWMKRYVGAPSILLRFVVMIAILVGVCWFAVRIAEYFLAKSGKPSNKSTWWKVGQAFLAVLLTAPLLLLAAILLFLPAIWLGVMLSFTWIFIVDKGLNAPEAMAASWKHVRGRWWQIFLRELLPKLFYMICELLLALPLILIAIVLFGSVIFTFFIAPSGMMAVGGPLHVIVASLGLWGVLLGVFFFFLAIAFYLAINVVRILYAFKVMVSLYRSALEHPVDR